MTTLDIAGAIRATAAALRAQADALDAFAAALKAPGGAPSGALLTRKTWPADAPCTWRVIADAARRGEIAMLRAGRTPAVRRADLDAWLAARPRATAPEVAPEDDDELDDYARAVRDAGGTQ